MALQVKLFHTGLLCCNFCQGQKGMEGSTPFPIEGLNPLSPPDLCVMVQKKMSNGSTNDLVIMPNCLQTGPEPAARPIIKKV